MRSDKRIFRSVVGVGLLILCLSFTGCELPDFGSADDPIELRSYEVPLEYQDDLRGMLQSALGSGDNRVGRVISGPGSTLLVTAPARIQEGIEQVLNADFDVPPASIPVTVTYWFLVGRPQDPSQTTPPFSVAGRNFPELEPVLAQIANTDGATEFAVLEQVQLTSMNQESAMTTSRFGRVSQQTARSGEKVVVNVDISLDAAKLSNDPFPGRHTFRSRVMLAPGQFLVLGRTGFDGRLPDAFLDPRGENELTLYYVMAADLVP